LISRGFVKLWEPRFDTQKFPADFYKRHSSNARYANLPEQLKEDLLALLHWKDGKALLYVPGMDTAKPNTLNPILELTDSDLLDFARSFQNLVWAKENDVSACTMNLRGILNGMWKTVVIPAFLLHVARPDRLPIIDQHTVRAFLALTRGEVIEKPKITWDLWKDYVSFFHDAVVATGHNYDLEKLCQFDRALFAWGKSLKGSTKSKPTTSTAKPPISPNSSVETSRISPSFWGQQVPKTGVIPSNCNVLKALEEYLNLGSLDSLPQYKKQNLRDLEFHKFEISLLRELLHEPGDKAAQQLLQYYKEKLGGGVDISSLPRPILDVFLVGWASICGISGTTKKANHLHIFGFGGTIDAAKAAVSVGKTTGHLFGILDDSGTPTNLFHDYFEV
jgi:hypothetical protein